MPGTPALAYGSLGEPGGDTIPLLHLQHRLAYSDLAELVAVHVHEEEAERHAAKGYPRRAGVKRPPEARLMSFGR